MQTGRHGSRGFTLIELLVTLAIITLLAGILVPSLSKARENARTLTCLARLREHASGWQMYATENDGMLVAGRMYKKPGGTANRENHYDIGNGLKYRPRWPATLGLYTGIFAYTVPSTTDDRQDYDNDIFRCPNAFNWVDERNYGYGYNYQFLGNGRRKNERLYNFPVFLGQIKATSGTVVMADCLGTAAGVAESRRLSYNNDGPNDFANLGNHGWALDPPRLTDTSDRGTGDPGSPRTAVDPRHRKKASVVFADGHSQSKTPDELGYRLSTGGCYVDFDPDEACSAVGGSDTTAWVPTPDTGEGRRVLQAPPVLEADWATNRFFSGTGRNDAPPPLPE